MRLPQDSAEPLTAGTGVVRASYRMTDGGGRVVNRDGVSSPWTGDSPQPATNGARRRAKFIYCAPGPRRTRPAFAPVWWP